MNARPFPIQSGRTLVWDILIVSTGELLGIRFKSYSRAAELLQ